MPENSFLDIQEAGLKIINIFFTHCTDFSGYDGSFTPGHLWFILFLFIISLSALPIIKYIPYKKLAVKFEKANIITIILLFIPVWLMYYMGNFGGYSFGKYFILFLLGYYVFSNETIINKLTENKNVILGLFGVLQAILVTVYHQCSYYGDFTVNLVCWLGILTCLILGKCYLNKETKLTEYFSKASFPIYLLHQSILVALGYYILSFTDLLFLQVIIIMLGSFVLTMLCYEVLKRIPCLNKMLGIK